MQVADLSLPTPVLGISDDVDGRFEVMPDIILGRDEILIKVKYFLANPSLERLISEGKAEFVTEISCSETIYRHAFKTSDKNQEIKLESDLLRDKVELSHWIVVSSDIPDYCPENANRDYSGYIFGVENGDVLAYGKSHIFLAEKSWLEFMSVSSFMVIRKDEREYGPANYDLHNDQIKIWLAKDDFERYRHAKTEPNLAPIFHSAIVLPALIYVLSELVVHTEGYSGRKWYLHLMMRKENDEQLKNINWDLDKVPFIAQTLLKNPLNRSFEGIESLIRSIQRTTQGE